MPPSDSTLANRMKGWQWPPPVFGRPISRDQDRQQASCRPRRSALEATAPARRSMRHAAAPDEWAGVKAHRDGARVAKHHLPSSDAASPAEGPGGKEPPRNGAPGFGEVLRRPGQGGQRVFAFPLGRARAPEGRAQRTDPPNPQNGGREVEGRQGRWSSMRRAASCLEQDCRSRTPIGSVGGNERRRRGIREDDADQEDAGDQAQPASPASPESRRGVVER